MFNKTFILGTNDYTISHICSQKETLQIFPSFSRLPDAAGRQGRDVFKRRGAKAQRSRGVESQGELPPKADISYLQSPIPYLLSAREARGAER